MHAVSDSCVLPVLHCINVSFAQLLKDIITRAARALTLSILAPNPQ